ncbi:sensor histidine kinase [Enterococcus sp. LJL90]
MTAFVLILFIALVFICWLFFLRREYQKKLVSIEAVLDQTLQQKLPENTLAFQEGQDSKIVYKAKRIAAMNQDFNQQVVLEQNRTQETIANISHQLKTPVASLSMYLELLENSSLTAMEQQEFMGRIQGNVERLRFLTEEILMIARLETNTLVLNQQISPLQETLMQVIQQHNSQAEIKECRIELANQSDLSLTYDSRWLMEALSNIVDNAVKYALPQTIIGISVEQLISYTRIQVTNQGPTISAEELPKIFQKYFRGSNSLAEDGVGIGLYLSKLIIEASGGYLVAESQQQLTTISIFLQN